MDESYLGQWPHSVSGESEAEGSLTVATQRPFSLQSGHSCAQSAVTARSKRVTVHGATVQHSPVTRSVAKSYIGPSCSGVK